MAETAQRQSAFEQLRMQPVRLRGASVAEKPPASRFSFRGGAEAAVAAGAAFGVDCPTDMLRAKTNGGRSALKLGPDEWLLIATDDLTPGFAKGLAETLKSVPCSLVEISHRQGAIGIFGTDAAMALNAACLLDLSLPAFPIGMCTRTIFSKAEIVLWRTGANDFHIEVWRSFTAYVAKVLEGACQDIASLEKAR